MNYYNDNDPYVAQWLRNLVDAGLLPPGDVDERSITEVTADDVRGYVTSAISSAGIAGWPLALQLAGWGPIDPVWTGSCPCQPLSSAGQRKGHADKRHLWPAFQRLISECKPEGMLWGAGLVQNLEGNGCPLYRVDLESQQDMPSGPPIFRLRASARRTSAKDCSGWPSPTAGEAKGHLYQYDNHDKTKPRLTNEGQLAG